MIASGSVGWAWMVRLMSSASAPISMASAASAMMSEAPLPTTWMPSTSLLSASMTTFTKPSVSALAMARPSATNGNLPILTLRPLFLASSAVMPAVAISGSLKMTAGMQRTSISALVAGDDLGDDLGLVRRLVRQHRLAGHVADGVDAGHVGAQLAIGRHEAALDLHAQLLEPQALGVRAAADGDQHLVGLDGRRPCRRHARA